MLSDPEKRQVYDNFGEAGLNGGGAGPSGGGGAGGFGGGMGGGISQEDAERIFASFFGGGGGGGGSGGFSFGGGGGGPTVFSFGGGSGDGGDPFGGLFGSVMGGGGSGGRSQGRRRRSQQQRPPRKAETIHRDLPLSLEELYEGRTKKMKVTRSLASGEREAKVLEINVKPGWKAGTKLTFENAGDERAGVIPADICFTLTEKPHARFQREGDNLVVTKRISLRQALTAEGTVAVTTLDGRRLTVPLPDNAVISPDYVLRVDGEGMPVSKRPGTYGDLLINFDIQFPSRLSDDQKDVLAAALPQ